jgi:hypothetical protein
MVMAHLPAVQHSRLHDTTASNLLIASLDSLVICIDLLSILQVMLHENSERTVTGVSRFVPVRTHASAPLCARIFCASVLAYNL